MKLKIGDSIPSFSLKDQNGNIRTSNKLKKSLVLFFYPKDDTPGCTIEACGFRDKYDLFKILGAEVWGISNGNRQSHLIFANKNNLQYPLLCDHNNILRKQFGVQKKLGFIEGRVTYIINSEGIIKHIFEDLLNGPAHIKEAIKALKELQLLENN
ncbi:peroxiredoxin [Prochlorococcus marinus]|uniref:peroxiredoxin n=1 Tax=Prochlorococcus marinus TaxID=1219 RepID=UPI0022B5D170|nr:peroxiredoxin [Prochlorococcus marinus]